jgi:hypothetical protein
LPPQSLRSRNHRLNNGPSAQWHPCHHEAFSLLYGSSQMVPIKQNTAERLLRPAYRFGPNGLARALGIRFYAVAPGAIDGPGARYRSRGAWR